MRLRPPIGAVPLIPLAALAAHAEGPVADPGPVRIQYEQRTSIEPGAAGGQGKHLMLGARIFADWTVKSADEKRIVLAAKVREARLECSRSGDATSEADMDGGEGCSVTASSGELEAIVTRAGASLAGDLVSFLRTAQIRQPGNPRAIPVPRYALEPFRVAITTAAFEAFAHLLTPTRVVTSDVRRLEVQDLQGRHAGAFEISFPPPGRWEAGDLGWASGSSRFTPPGGKAVDLLDRPVRLTWTHRGRRRDEWIARLGHPGSNPIPMTYDTRRRVTVEARFSARWLGEESPGPEAVLERVELAAGQRFLVDLSTNEELRTSARALASRSWHEATGILALAVAEAPGQAGGVRFEGLFVSGMLREASVAGVSAARIFDPASLQTVPSLAGVVIGAEKGKDGLAVTVDDASWRSALGAIPRDAGGAGALHAALSRAVTASLQAALADPAPGSPPVWSATILDAEGNAVGEASLAYDGKAPQKSNEYRLDGRRLERKTFPLAAACRGPVAPIAPRSDGSAPVLSRVIDWLLPMPAEASLQASLEARDPKAPASAPISVTAWLQTRIKARQIGGPRCRLPPAAPAPVAPAAPPPLPARPPDTSPLPPPELAAAAPAAVKAKVEAIFADLPAGRAGVDIALERYGRLEAGEPRSHAAAAAHAEIVLHLRDRVDRESLPSLAPRLDPASPFAVRVLAMRLVTHAPGLEDADRARALAPLLDDVDRYTILLAGRFLGWIRDPASVEALIGALERLEKKVEPGPKEPVEDRELRLSLAGDLYRLLGEGASRTAAAGFRDLWARRGRKLSADPFAPGTPTSVTMVRSYRTFSDVRSAPIVFLLDASSSMAEPVPAGGVPLPPSVGRQGSAVLEKLAWARGDLEAILEDLEPGTRFQVISFNKTTRVLGSSLATVSKASRGTGASLGPARAFLKGVKSERGTNIHAALAKAFELPEVGAVCLLSDGHPTAGPGPDEIERDVFRWNYLRGARIVAASFTGDIAHPDNLCSRLARRWFGWVRALDAGAVAAPAPGPDAPPAPVDSDY